MSVGGLSDSELVALARAGHEPAFDAIVHRYRAPLTSYCRRWVDPHRAEEVVQHTFMKAFICLRDDDRPLALRPWLYRVTHNAALNALEKKGSEWEELDENYDGVPQPPQVAEQRARFLKVVGEIDALPVRQREALVLNEFEGRCYADIAAELGTSESGVRGLLRRARRQLREAAAAVLMPFPVLRELARADGGRSIQPERAGEILGSAGAAGGLGAAGGGLAKIAAGVLAAGTIAGGGTALEHRQDAWRAPAAQAQEASDEVADRARPAQRLMGADAAPDRVSVDPAAHIRTRRAVVERGGVGAPRTIEHEATLGEVEVEDSEEPPADATPPAKPTVPLIVIDPDAGGGSEDESTAEQAPEDEPEPASGQARPPSGGEPSAGSGGGQPESGSSSPLLPQA